MADTVNNIALTVTSSRHLTDEQKVKLQKATKDFESIFVQMMLKSMRSAQGEESKDSNEFGGDSYGGDTMKGMLDTELSNHLGHQGKLGIAESLYKKLTGESLPVAAARSGAPVKSKNAAHKHKKDEKAIEIPASLDAKAVPVTAPNIIDKISIPSPFSFNSVQQSVLSADNKLRQLDAARAAGQVAPVIEQSAPEIEQSATQAEQSFQEIELPPSPQAMTPGKVTMISSPAQAKRDLSAAAPGTMAPVTANAALERVKSYSDIIARTADSVGVDPNLLKAMIVEESGAKQHARSSSNAKGLMQLIDTTAQSMGVKNVWDPHQNIQGGARYLKQQLDKYKGDVSLALASYNAGPGNVERYNGIPPFKETRNYVKRVMNLYAAFQSLEKNNDEVIK